MAESSNTTRATGSSPADSSSKASRSGGVATAGAESSSSAPAVVPEGMGPAGLDWNALYTRDFVMTRGGEEDADYWNGRARTFGTHSQPRPGGPAAHGAPSPASEHDAHATARPSAYAAEFLRLAGLVPGESVIDMGCGTGALAIPAAAQVHPVVACDLAQGMLDRLEARARVAQVERMLDVRRMSWLDPWDDLPQVDVFFSSRSLFTRDLRATLDKMEAHTRRRCCVTVATADSPLRDRAMLAAIGRPRPRNSEHVYLFNLLSQMGRLPRVAYIEHVKPVSGSTREEVLEGFSRDAGPLTADEESALRRFVDEHFDFTARDASGLPLRDYDQPVRWAFLSWDVPARA